MEALLILTDSENENYNADCDYALIPWDAVQEVAALKTRVLQAKDLFPMADKSSFEVSFFTGSITMLDSIAEELFPEVVKITGSDWIVEMPDLTGFELPRTECDRIHASVDWVYWSVIPKHCNFRVTTQEIRWEVLEKQP